MMQRCLSLAQQAAGYTAPNPLVGAVITQETEVVGEGYHPQAGQPHAEVFALRAAGDRAVGGTLYVNLEPCNHYGRTPPCTEAVIQAGIRRVYVGMIDPDERVSGQGVARLREAGLEVIVGLEEAACLQLNEAFVHRIQHHRPFGILKYAMTLDGKIAATSGHSAWVTGPAARTRVHQLRAVCDAVIIGGNTLRRDNPHLTSHGQSDRNPLRVVMSQQLNLPLTANLWQVEVAKTLVLTQTGANPQLQDQLRQKGVEVVALDSLTPATAMEYLYQRQLLSVLWECGGQLAAAAIAAAAVQKVLAFVAPKIIGGQGAPSPVGDLGLTAMTQARPLERLRWQMIGSDLLVEGYLA
ncbi:MAG: bifunctional diaminohydroxyphosphoribosylaminopyrimidine deaminase/5-amino-6-(5-phosphoribosylamino)uracil reductase RibD [Leptolyngbya sp. SIO4C5]|nr:bifunctional diaminohydroxyphosphoribosylaminopyrimidine deaminase/5-amino-6-(5-phosphoribosylamino)uracil reductase RibD [Leptolyngbya sp. SIO4C5]